MNFILFDDAAGFQSKALPFVMQHEAENNLMVGIVGAATSGRPMGGDVLFCAVEDGGCIVAAGVMTPPHRIVLTRGPCEAIERIAMELHARGRSLPGVMAPSRSAWTYAEAWTRLSGQPHHPGKGLRTYQLDRVTPAERATGRLEAATPADLELAVEWMDGFSRDAHLPLHSGADAIREWIERQGLFFWKVPEPVNMAAVAGPTPNGIRISTVYTPPALRGRGYASACVAALSQREIDAGRKFCFLFTDLANPTSNSIYQKIGYQPVCDFQEVEFEPA